MILREKLWYVEGCPCPGDRKKEDQAKSRFFLRPLLANEKRLDSYVFVVNHDVYFHITTHGKPITNDDDAISKYIFSYMKKKVTVRDILSWLENTLDRLITALRNPRGTNGIRRPVWGRGIFCFVRDCGRRGTARRSDERLPEKKLLDAG